MFLVVLSARSLILHLRCRTNRHKVVLLLLLSNGKGESLQLLSFPTGEALIHRYYREGIIQLAALPQVTGISCQTNLSFPAGEWLDELRTAPELINKIKIWASFHPEMTSVERFVHQLHTLHNAGIQVCAGAVGNPLAKNILADLRNTLSPDIYLFINAMQGLKSPLSNEDIRFFTQLDNLFEYDLRNAPAQWENCSGGRSACFIDWKGDIFACPRSKVKIGNLYRSQKLDTSLSCQRKVCDCYIAFSNLTNHPLHSIMGKGTFLDTDKPLITAVFRCGRNIDRCKEKFRKTMQCLILYGAICPIISGYFFISGTGAEKIR